MAEETQECWDMYSHDIRFQDVQLMAGYLLGGIQARELALRRVSACHVQFPMLVMRHRRCISGRSTDSAFHQQAVVSVGSIGGLGPVADPILERGTR